ncbi:hypothetical protein G5I_13150 [Acromyrmex echinatior]|uniref:Uncharacterized protein n=1 Tax=Acromyrmex echinatior TaxID=103372 RepID=F4X491_ACREC|nr:hypothetical protein G5I_13150 [Acromyrmex echinatior]
MLEDQLHTSSPESLIPSPRTVKSCFMNSKDESSIIISKLTLYISSKFKGEGKDKYKSLNFITPTLLQPRYELQQDVKQVLLKSVGLNSLRLLQNEMVKRMSRDAVALSLLAVVLPDKFEKYLKFNHELSEKLHAFAPQSKDYLKLVSGNTRAFSPNLFSSFCKLNRDYPFIGDTFCCLKSEIKFIYRTLLTQLLKLYYSCKAKSDNSYYCQEVNAGERPRAKRKDKECTCKAGLRGRQAEMGVRCRHSDEERTSDRTFPFYLPVPQGQSISLEYYTIVAVRDKKNLKPNDECKNLDCGVIFYLLFEEIGNLVCRSRLLIFDKVNKVNKFSENALALCHVVTPSRIIEENTDLQKSRGLKLVMVHVSKNILLTQQVIDVVLELIRSVLQVMGSTFINAIDYCVTYSEYSNGNYLWLSKKRNWIRQLHLHITIWRMTLKFSRPVPKPFNNSPTSVGVVQHRTLTISFDEIRTFLAAFHFREFPLDYVKRSYRAFHSDAPGAPITLPFGGRNKREGGINHREVRARGMHYAHYLERISIVEPESIGRNNAIETYQEGGTLQIAQIQTVRQVPTDNLAYPRVFETIGRRE